jgi:nucleoside-diphosphate-sugar epimerase
MSAPEKTVVVTGIAGNLGVRLLREIPEFDVCGLDLHPVHDQPVLTHHPSFQFQTIDLGEEPSCRELIDLLRKTEAQSVVHLAFVIDPLRTGVLDVDRMWRINVAGTARVMEAVAVVNRNGGVIKRVIYVSSVAAYGSDLPGPVSEDQPLAGHTLPYAIHKRESDQVVQTRAKSLGVCSTYILRPNIFAGASMRNYLINILRGTPYGQGRLGRWLERSGRKLPALVPYGRKYLDTRFQYVHVDDMARLLAWILRQPGVGRNLTILNVAGRGEALTFERCAQIAGTRVTRLPGKAGCRAALSLVWKLGLSSVPAAAVPYFTGTYLMDTSRLREFLGKDYEDVIRYSIEAALADSFKQESSPAAAHAIQAPASKPNV